MLSRFFVAHFTTLSIYQVCSASKCGVILALCIHKFKKKGVYGTLYFDGLYKSQIHTKYFFTVIFLVTEKKNFLVGIVGVSVDC